MFVPYPDELVPVELLTVELVPVELVPVELVPVELVLVELVPVVESDEFVPVVDELPEFGFDEEHY